MVGLESGPFFLGEGNPEYWMFMHVVAGALGCGAVRLARGVDGMCSENEKAEGASCGVRVLSWIG